MQKEYKSGSGQTLYDICLIVYGTVDYLMKLATENNITDLDYVTVTGDKFTYDDTVIYLYRTSTQIKAVQQYYPTYTIREFAAESRQSLYDVCLNVYFDLDNVVQFARDNEIETMQYVAVTGDTVNYDTTLISNKAISKHTESRNIKYVTSVIGQGGYWLTPDGSAWETEDGVFWELP